MPDLSPAEAYEKFLVPFAFGPWARLVIEDASFKSGQSVLDVCCGTGVAARLVAAVVGSHGSVIGVDIDDGMLSVARRSVVRNDAAKIEWRQADASKLPFENGSFDAVLCFEGLQFFSDRAKALAEFRRVLKPQGRLAGTLWGALQENVPYQALAEGLARFVSPEAGKLPPFALSDPAVIHDLLANARFSDILVEPRSILRRLPSAREFVQWVAAGAPTTRHKLAQLAAKDREEFLCFVEKRLEEFRRDGELEVPTMRHVFTASAQ